VFMELCRLHTNKSLPYDFSYENIEGAREKMVIIQRHTGFLSKVKRVANDNPFHPRVQIVQIALESFEHNWDAPFNLGKRDYK